MAWKVELSQEADGELSKLDSQRQRRILRFLEERLSQLDDPRSIGGALQGARFGEFWKYRVGSFRLICKIQDDRRAVLVLRIGHRKEIYR